MPGVVRGKPALQRFEMPVYQDQIRAARAANARDDGCPRLPEAPVTITVRPVHSACINCTLQNNFDAAIVTRFVLRRRPSFARVGRVHCHRCSPATENDKGFSLKRPFYKG